VRIDFDRLGTVSDPPKRPGAHPLFFEGRDSTVISRLGFSLTPELNPRADKRGLSAYNSNRGS